MKLTKKYLSERCKNILHNAIIGDVLLDDNFSFMLRVLEMHPNSAKKKGDGVDKIFISESPFKNKQFSILRYDGTTTDFSYHICIRKFNHFTKLSLIFRNSLIDSNKIKELEGYKDNFNLKDIHHITPFKQILLDFFKYKNIDYNTIELISKDNYAGGYLGKNEYLKKEFVVYHDSVAELELISKDDHLKKHKKED